MSAKAIIDPKTRRPIIVTRDVALGLTGPFTLRMHAQFCACNKDGDVMRQVEGPNSPGFDSHGVYIGH